MKRIIGFLAGLTLALGLAYLIKRLLEAQPASSAPAAQFTGPSTIASTKSPAAPAKQNPDSASDNENENPERVVTRYTVRRSGPRPQSPANLEGAALQNASQIPETAVTGHESPADPLAATHTDPAASSPRSELTEPAILDDVKVQSPAPKSPKKKKPLEIADFTQIHDLGPVFNNKLHEAGINTFAELAALTPEQIEEKTAIPAARVERSEWIKQAARLADGLSPES